MHDVLPQHTALWQYVEQVIRDVLNAYGYREIRLPIVEKTELFKRSIGEVTDIVEKEMYTFDDRNGDSLTLRPEGTAGCLRACLEHGLLHNQVQRLWYYGPMFRHERPQKGRYRQFVQLGVETYGMAGPDVDAEIILVSARLWKRLHIADKLQLQINTLGTLQERMRYREVLVDYFKAHKARLDEDSLRRLQTNPLRILDSKNPQMQDLIAEAPVLMDYLGKDSRAHFEGVLQRLELSGVDYVVNSRLVRGLDYYGKTVFEWVTDALGAQGTVCAGGRYDQLIEQLGGRANTAIGFAMGMERLLALLAMSDAPQTGQAVNLYLIQVGALAEKTGLQLAERIRDELPAISLVMHCGGGSFKSQFKKADKSGTEYALILGDEEAASGQVSIKPMRSGDEQQTLTQDQALAYLKTILKQEG